MLDDSRFQVDQGMLHEGNDKAAVTLLEVEEKGRKKLSTIIYTLLLEGLGGPPQVYITHFILQHHPHLYAGVLDPTHHELNLAIAMRIAMILGH